MEADRGRGGGGRGERLILVDIGLISGLYYLSSEEEKNIDKKNKGYRAGRNIEKCASF